MPAGRRVFDTSGTRRPMAIAGKMLPDLDAATTDRLWLNATREVHTATAPVFGMILVRDRSDMAQAVAADGPGGSCIWR
jgi:hypothetical protein